MPSPLNAQPAVKKKRDDKAHDRAAKQARRDKITEANATNSPLLCLPGDLRNLIYTYVFSGNKWTFENWTPAARRNSAKENDLGLLFTCRQLHTETALLPYTLGRFTFRMIYVSQEQGED